VCGDFDDVGNLMVSDAGELFLGFLRKRRRKKKAIPFDFYAAIHSIQVNMLFFFGSLFPF